MGTPRWWEILLPASSRSAEYARLDPGRVRRSICRALVTVCQLQPSRLGPSVSSLGPGQSLSQAARRASTSSRTPSITKVGGVCSDPSGAPQTTTCCGCGSSSRPDLASDTPTPTERASDARARRNGNLTRIAVRGASVDLEIGRAAIPARLWPVRAAASEAPLREPDHPETCGWTPPSGSRGLVLAPTPLVADDPGGVRSALGGSDGKLRPAARTGTGTASSH